MRVFNKDQFIDKAKNTHDNKYDYSNVVYINSHTKVIIACINHGLFEQTPNNHLRGHGCPVCAEQDRICKNKLSKYEFIKKSTAIHGGKYNYSKVVYVGGKKKVIIICPIHGEFVQEAGHHMRGDGCYKCGRASSKDKNTLTTNNFIEKSNDVHGIYTYDKTEYINSHKKVIITCPIHGDFKQTPNSHLNGCGCSKCAIETNSDKQRFNNEIFVEKSISLYGSIYNYSKVKYINARTPVIISCIKHGDFLKIPDSHLRGSGCSKCAWDSLAQNRSLGIDEFIKRSELIHGTIYGYSKIKYINANEKVLITCYKHGDFLQYAGVHYTGSGCPKCGIGSSVIGNRWLDSIGIPNDDKHREVEKLIPGRKFRVDGFVPETNTVYEFYGDCVHGNPNIFDANDISPFGIRYGDLYNKTIKRECIFKELGFNLVTIWESDFRKQLIQEFIKNKSSAAKLITDDNNA